MSIKALTGYNVDLKIILAAVIYYFAADFGHLLAFDYSNALPAWSPSGIAFALIILLGRKSWPGITIGTLVANIIAFWNMPDVSPQTIIFVSSTIALGNTLECLVGYYLINNWIKTPFPFQQTNHTFIFLFVSVLIATIGSGIAAFSLFANGILDQYQFLMSWLSIGAGKLVSILLFTPFILSFFRKYSFKFSKAKWIEILVASLTIVGLVFLIQVQDVNDSLIRGLPYIIIPFLLWLAVRFPLGVSMSAVVIISVFAIYLTSISEGPFVLSDTYSSLLLLQIYIGVVSITTIILAATVKERGTVQEELLKFNDKLERSVKERTKALKDEVETRRDAEESLQKTNQELSKRNVELDNFVYSVSHDLRAPIASVLGIINLAKLENDTAMKDHYFDMINGSALQLDNFIMEILDQSRNARLDIKREKIAFQDLIDETFEQLKFASANGKPVEKIVQIKQKKAFYSDPWRMKVVLNNIISNAIRYRNGKDPVIKVDVSVEKGIVKLIIEDNGRGISEEHLDKVYEMFYRATDDGAGSGLGLYIVKETIDKLNGEIRIESEEGKGTKVILEIPEIPTSRKVIKAIDLEVINN
jgi:signal transduction histidine kinase